MNPENNLFPKPSLWKPRSGTSNTSVLTDPHAFQDLAVIDQHLPAEGYRLSILENEVQVEVGSNAAIRFARQHLLQLQGDHPERTPCGVLEDSPVFDRRAFMLDVSRCKVPTREGFRQWLNILSGFRYNELQLYTEHTFAYSNHEQVWKDASPLTPEDITWLQQECEAYGIRLVPNQNCFGHFERWIKHADYQHYAESPEGFITPWGDQRTVGSVLKPDDASFALVCELLDELLPLFNCDRVNIGCDETFELGQGATKARCEKEGMGSVYADFVQRIMTYVEETHAMKPEFWGDILVKYPEEIGKLSPAATALCWGYEADSPLAGDCVTYAKSGLPFTVCPGTSSWRSFAGRTENMIANITQAAKATLDGEADGMLLTDWGDCGHLQVEPVSYGPMSLFGLLAWQGPEASVEDAWAWCDKVAFEGQTGDTACWLNAGRISEQTGISPPNANLLFKWFLDPNLSEGESVSNQTLSLLKENIEELPRPSTFREEWSHTLANLRLSIQRVEDHRNGTTFATEQLPEAQKNHARIWRKRNREGGLAESLETYT